MPSRLAAVVAALAVAGCGTWGDGSDVRPRPDHPEAWPPTNATECFRARPAESVDAAFPAVLAVRDGEQTVAGGVVEVVLCAGPQSAFPAGDRPLVATVDAIGGVTSVSPSGVRWSPGDDLVVPIRGEVRGPGRVEVVVGERVLAVDVVRLGADLVVREAPVVR